MYGIILLYKAGSTFDETAVCRYRAVLCDGVYRHVTPRFDSMEAAEEEAERLSDLGYEA